MRFRIPRGQRKLDFYNFFKATEEVNIQPFGADIKHKQDNALRIAVQNINGFRFDAARAGAEEVDAMDKLGLDIFGLVETNINWSHEAKLRFEAMMRLQFTHAPIVTSSAPAAKEGYLPGGNAMVARGRVAGRVGKRHGDRLGRYSYMALSGKDNTGILVITLYRVCQKKGTKVGPGTAYMQQYEGLRKAGITDPDPRKQTFVDVTTLIQEWRAKQYIPIVMGDFNSTANDNDMKAFMRLNGLVDLIGSTNDGDPPPTYSRSARRLDYILGDKVLIDSIIQSGSLQQDEGVLSDHTLQWVDFDPKLLFRNTALVPMTVGERQFTLTNAKKKHLFQEKLQEIHAHQKIPERVTTLARDFAHASEGGFSDQEFITLVDRYQCLDREIQDSIISAANSTGRKDFGYQRSPQLVATARAVVMWKSLASSKRRTVGITDRARQLSEELSLDISDFPVWKTKDIEERLRIAYMHKREAQKNDGELRAKWLEELAQEAALDKPDKEWQDVLKEMIAAARQRSLQRKLTSIMKPPRSGLDYIEVPIDPWLYHPESNELYEFDEGLFKAHSRLPNGTFRHAAILKVPPKKSVAVSVEHTEASLRLLTDPNVAPAPRWERITKTEEIEAWLCRRNKRHHQQVDHDESPPTLPPLSTLLGEHGTTAEIAAILSGDMDIEAIDVPDYVKHWLRWMELTQAERDLQSVPPKITPSQFKEAFRVQDELTSSSASGLHYTLWKAIAEIDDCCKYMAVMMSLPFQYGFTNTRWQTAIDVMLEKKFGVRQIHLMRIIGLVEADFNTALKILFAKQLMTNAEKAGISSDQWGGRANRSAPDCATRKLLTWEDARISKKNVGSFFGDLASCFDRMKTSISNVVAAKKGMPASVGEARSLTVRGMQRHVRTAGGTSTVTYREDPDDVPLSGEIQGKGDVMGLWTLVSDSILAVHRQLTRGVSICHAALDYISQRSADSYVDDTDTYAEDEGPIDWPDDDDDEDEGTVTMMEQLMEDDPATPVIADLNASAQLWTNLVNMVGGLMAFHKCNWQLLTWKPFRGELIPRDRDEFQGDLILEDHKGLQTRIAYKSHKEANVGLGFSLTPLGDQTPEFTVRLGQLRECITKLSVTALTTTEAWMLMTTRFLPKFTYPFMLTRFTHKQLRAMAVIFDNAMLPVLRINRNTPRAMVYAPADFGGFEFPCLKTVQDQKGIGHIVRHLKWGKEIGQDFRNVISKVQLESGLIDPILESPKTYLSYLTEGHISHIRERLRALEGGIWVEDTWSPSLQRRGDISLMERFLQIKASPAKYRAANLVRLWLRVITIAELADESGLRIPAERLNGEWQAESTLRWPNATRPSPKMFRTFQWFLRRTFCQQPARWYKRHPLPLDVPLGPWLQVDRHISHAVYRTEEWVYERQVMPGQQRIMRYGRHSHARTGFTEDTVVDDIPAHAIPITAESRGSFILPIQLYETEAPQAIAPAAAPPECRTENPEHIHEAPRLTVVSDGSMDPVSGRAAFEWIITTAGREGYIKRAMPIAANPNYMSSYRAELAGIYDALKYLHDNGMAQKPMDIWCDNEACIKVLTSDYAVGLAQMNDSECDLVRAIQDYLSTMPDALVQHVYGHQDDTTNQLTLEAELNVECDAGAKACMWASELPASRPDPTPGSGAALYLGNDLVTTDMDEQIQVAAHGKAACEYLQEKYEWTDNMMVSIHWQGIRHGLRRKKRHEHIRLSKMTIGWLNVGRQKLKITKEDGAELCPCCGEVEEDFLHLYHCPNQEMQQAREKGIVALQKTLYDANVPRGVIKAFVHSVSKAAHSTVARPCPTCEHATRASELQSHLGGQAILRGHLSTAWIDAVRETYQRREVPPGDTPRRDRTPPDMVGLMIETVWKLFDTVWQKRNDIANGDDSTSTAHEETVLNNKLISFHRGRRRLLHPGDWHLIDYKQGDILAWDRRRKKGVLRLLRSCHRAFNAAQEEEIEEKRQKRLKNYYPVVRVTRRRPRRRQAPTGCPT